MLPALLPALSARRRALWLSLQAVLLLAGCGILAALLLAPRLGLDLLWNGLIPAAPALLVFVPGLWRNVCPLATVALLPRKLGLSRGVRLRRVTQARIALAGVLLLFALVPARRVIFDADAAGETRVRCSIGEEFLLRACELVVIQRARSMKDT